MCFFLLYKVFSVYVKSFRNSQVISFLFHIYLIRFQTLLDFNYIYLICYIRTWLNTQGFQDLCHCFVFDIYIWGLRQHRHLWLTQRQLWLKWKCMQRKKVKNIFYELCWVIKTITKVQKIKLYKICVPLEKNIPYISIPD